MRAHVTSKKYEILGVLYTFINVQGLVT